MAYRKLPKKRTPQEILALKRAWYYRAYEPKPAPPAPCKVGDRFGRLTVTEVRRVSGNHYTVQCLCDCGITTYPRFRYLKLGKVKSCGCLQREYSRNEGNIRFEGAAS